MKTMDDLKEMLDDEIRKIVKKGDITPTELDSVCKAVKTLSNIETIKAMQEYGRDEGYSQDYSGRMYRDSYDSYASRGSYSPRGSYDMSRDGGSYMRGRDARTGRYVSRDDGYSGHAEMHERLKAMMQEADPQDRQILQECIERLEK